ncbi:hypothetical protein Bca101_045182 [Brassica carinata]
MSSSSPYPALRPAPVPPDLLFLHPLPVPEAPVPVSSFLPDGELRPLVSPPGAEFVAHAVSSLYLFSGYSSSRSLLIFVPCPVARQWVLDVGFWHSGNCSFTALLWHPSINLSEMKLVHAPVWVLFKKVPIELWSTLGFSTMASALGFPVHSEYPDLKPYSNGVVKLQVVIELAKPRPSVVRVTDKLGNSVSLPVEFLKLPPKCGGCGEYGHLRLRCFQPSSHKIALATENPPYMGVMASPPVPSSAEDSLVFKSPAHSPLSEGSAREASDKSVEKGPCSGSISSTPLPSPSLKKRQMERSKSLPLSPPTSSHQSPSSEWQYVAVRSKPSKSKEPPSPVQEVVVPVSNAKFAEEEELISTAQRILRDRLSNLENQAPGTSKISKKEARRKIRQNLYLLSCSSEGGDSSSFVSIPKGGTKDFSLAGGQAQSRAAHSQKA